MFRNYIMISYRRHKYFCPISVYIFTKRRCEYFLTKPFQFFLTISSAEANLQIVSLSIIET